MKEYVYLAVKKGVVTAEEWKGSACKTKWNIYQEDLYTGVYVYLPYEVDVEEFELELYDGDTKIGVAEMMSSGPGVEIWAGAMYPELYGEVDLAGKGFCNRQYYGEMKWSYELTPGKNYAMRATVEGVTYDLGVALCDSEKYIYASSTYDISSTSPVVDLTVWGYEVKDLLVQLVEEETLEVLATSEGGTLVQTAQNNGYAVLASEYSAEELQKKKLYLQILYQGEEIYKENFSVSTEVPAAYYDHVNQSIIVRTYGIPDNTLISTTIWGVYTAQGVVVDGKATLPVLQGAELAGLPADDYDVTFKYYIGDYQYSRTVYDMKVMGTEKRKEDVAFLPNEYFSSGNVIPIEVIVKKSAVETLSGEFALHFWRYGNSTGGETVSVTATDIVYNNEECWLVKGEMPALEPMNVDISLYKGSRHVYSTEIGVIDSTKLYAQMVERDCIIENGGEEKKIVLSFPYDDTGLDKSRFALAVTDMAGNATQITYAVQVLEDENIYTFENIPDNLREVRVTVTYAGQPVYNIRKFQDNQLLSCDMYWGNSFYVDETKVDLDNGYELLVACRPVRDAVAYVVETGTLNIAKVWDLAPRAEETYFDADMLAGLNYGDARVAYDIYFVFEGGYYELKNVYLGMCQKPIVVENGIGRDMEGNYWLYENGEIAYHYSGLYYWGERDAWVMIASGRLDVSFTGLAYVNERWWYVNQGFIDFSYTGLADANGAVWLIQNGEVAFNYYGLACVNDEWFYIVGGRVDTSFNGMAYVNDAWWYVVNGKVDFSFTGLTYVNEKWWYVNQGRIDFTYHGVCEFNGATWYIVNGEIDYATDGLVCVGEDWYFVQNGSVRTDYSGMLFVNDAWWYVVSGKIDFGFSGLFLFNNDYWFVSQGQIILGYVGLVFYDNQWWYLENGVVNFNYNGFAYVNDIWWWVENGKIDFEYCGIQTFNGMWWYVNKAQIDFTYNGTVTGPDGNIYEVVNGEVLNYNGA